MHTNLRRLSSLLLLLVAAALLAAACGGDDDSSSSNDSKGSSNASSSDGDCGATKDGDVDIVRHCGDASGEITVDGETTEFGDGACANTDDSLVVNLGTSVVDLDPTDDDRAKHTYLGIVAGKHPAADDKAPAVDKDGTFTEGVLISAVLDGTNVAATEVELKLEDDRNEGTISGTDLTGKEFSGSFSCS